MPYCALPEPSGNIIVRAFIGRHGKYLIGLPELDQLVHEKKGGIVRHPGRLLGIIGDENYRIVAFQ
jgi:hypothetical protein